MSQPDQLNKHDSRQYNDASYFAEDEISLIDLAKVVIKRKTTLLVVFVLFVLAGLSVAMLKKKQYQYGTTIEIGTTIVKGDPQLIDDPNTLLAKIQETYIPLAQHHLRAAHPENNKIYDLKARIPKNSTVIVLEGKGGADEADNYIQLQNDIIDQIIADHNRIILIIRKNYQNAIEKIKNEISSFEDQLKLLQGKQERLVENEKLVAKQIEQTRKLVTDGILNREKVSRRVQDETRAMTLLMIDNELQQNRRHQDALEEKLTVTLANEKDEIEKQIADIRRMIIEKRSMLEKVNLELENLRRTHSLVPPMKSIEPVGVGRVIILLVAVILGMLFSLFSVFIHEFISRARDELQSSTNQV